MIRLVPSGWHYRHTPRPRVPDPTRHAQRAYRSRIEGKVRARIGELITAGWRNGHSADHAFAEAWDEGLMLASNRSWWRIAAALVDQSERPLAPTRQSRQSRSADRSADRSAAAPVLTATAPGQVWSWDITDLRTPWRGMAVKAYCIIDIFSRKIVGWRVEDREVDDLARDVFELVFGQYAVPEAVHADSGPAMRSNVVKRLLPDCDVAQTHNRRSSDLRVGRTG